MFLSRLPIGCFLVRLSKTSAGKFMFVLFMFVEFYSCCVYLFDCFCSFIFVCLCLFQLFYFRSCLFYSCLFVFFKNLGAFAIAFVYGPQHVVHIPINSSKNKTEMKKKERERER